MERVVFLFALSCAIPGVASVAGLNFANCAQHKLHRQASRIDNFN